MAVLQLHCSRPLCVSLFAQCQHDACAVPMHAWICCLLQGQKGRLGKAIFECVLLAGSLLTPLLSSVCVLFAIVVVARSCAQKLKENGGFER